MATTFIVQILASLIGFTIAGIAHLPAAGLPRYYAYNIAEHCTIGAGLGFVIINQSINMQEIAEASKDKLGRIAFSHLTLGSIVLSVPAE